MAAGERVYMALPGREISSIEIPKNTYILQPFTVYTRVEFPLKLNIGILENSF